MSQEMKIKFREPAIADYVIFKIEGKEFCIKAEPSPDPTLRYRLSPESLAAVNEKLRNLDCPFTIRAVRR